MSGSGKTLRRDLCAITGDGVAYSVMVGCGETYLVAFALALGISEVIAGLVSTVPLLAGAILQLATPAALRRLGSHRRWIILCVIVQACSFIPLVAAAAIGAIPAPLLFAVAALYWAAGLAAGPAWNTWVGTLVPASLRSHFFARRSRWCQLATLVSLAAAGLILQAGKPEQGYVPGEAMWSYVLIFACAGLSRAVSGRFLAAQSEPQPMPDEHREVPFHELLARAQGRGDMRLLMYMLVMTLMVQFSGPYFAPYMLGELQFSYHEYLSLLAAAYISKSVVMPTMGWLVRALGAKATLWIGGLGVIPLPFLWTIGDSFSWLIMVQIVSGLLWAAYELATFLLLFDHIPEHERTSVLTSYNLFSAIATVVGSLLGAALLSRMGVGREGYMTMFLIAVGLRMLTVVLLARVTGVQVKSVVIALRTLAVRPATGGLDRPIVAAFEPAHENQTSTDADLPR
jgi:MFS family permease